MKLSIPQGLFGQKQFEQSPQVEFKSHKIILSCDFFADLHWFMHAVDADLSQVKRLKDFHETCG
ncbi:MAG: hypothetical protein PHQ13_15220 [Rhodoferax sp.]|nr:hypothetical protein [Rhodoferax sp.]MDD4944872.1 hypothetical protein [Rhodoferax sp.]